MSPTSVLTVRVTSYWLPVGYPVVHARPSARLVQPPICVLSAMWPHRDLTLQEVPVSPAMWLDVLTAMFLITV